MRAEMPPEVARLRMVGALSLLVGALIRRGYGAEQAEERDSFQARIVQSVREHIEHTAGQRRHAGTPWRASLATAPSTSWASSRSTGCTVHGYIDRCRLRRAREMQAQGARERRSPWPLGFSCPAAFSRCYAPGAPGRHLTGSGHRSGKFQARPAGLRPPRARRYRGGGSRPRRSM